MTSASAHFNTTDSAAAITCGGVMKSAGESDKVDEALLHQAVYSAMSQLPKDNTLSFYKAFQEVPHLVSNESNPLWFYRREDSNAVLAAKRLAAYWQYRCDVFQDRAFLPISTLSGQGALDQDDIEYMRSGNVVRLPNTLDGRVVFCVNREYAPTSSGSAWLTRRARALFYLFGWLAAKEVTSQDPNGIVVLRVVHKDTTFDRIGQREVVASLHEAFPIRFAPIQMCVVVPPGAAVDTYRNTITPVGHSLITDNWKEAPEDYFAITPKDMWKQLQKKKYYYQEALPVTLGGTWTYEKHKAWIDYRIYRDLEKERTFERQGKVNNTRLLLPPWHKATLAHAVKIQRISNTTEIRRQQRKLIKAKMDILRIKQQLVEK